eukprot:2403906-Prymnesium_polylepis.1
MAEQWQTARTYTLAAAAFAAAEPNLSFLHAFAERAECAYLYRSMALWCTSAAVDSLGALQLAADDFRKQSFYLSLLAPTKERLDHELARDPASLVPAAAP